MAATITASSSVCCKKLSSLSFANSLTLVTTHFSSKPKTAKPLNLRAHVHNFPRFPLISLPRFYSASPQFDGFEAEEDSQSLEQEDPEAESSASEEKEEKEEEEEPNLLGSSEEGRLYIGNLPYSMTSAQLAEVLVEAGRVVSVEVCNFPFRSN